MRSDPYTSDRVDGCVGVLAITSSRRTKGEEREMVIKNGVEFGEQLIEFIESAIATEDDPIEADTDLLLTGLVDSLGVILIVDWLEEQLDLEIDPADVTLENFRRVSDMVTYLGRRGAVADPVA